MFQCLVSTPQASLSATLYHQLRFVASSFTHLKQCVLALRLLSATTATPPVSYEYRTEAESVMPSTSELEPLCSLSSVKAFFASPPAALVGAPPDESFSTGPPRNSVNCIYFYSERKVTVTEKIKLTLCCSVVQSCLTLCDPVDCSTPGFPVLHHLLGLAQTHVH